MPALPRSRTEEVKLRRWNSAVPYKIMNKLGVMKGSKNTAHNGTGAEGIILLLTLAPETRTVLRSCRTEKKYGGDSAVPYKIMNKLGVMKGSRNRQRPFLGQETR